MAKTMTVVPVRGDRSLNHKLNLLATLRDRTVGDLVREAVDQVHGEALEEVTRLFPATSGKQTNRRKAAKS